MEIITIDGPSGVGKGTLGVYLADRLNFNYLNSGALYRSIGYIADLKSIDLADEEMLISITQSIAFNFNKASKDIEIIYKNKNINKKIFNEKTAKTASKIASISSLRKSIVNIQRSFAKEPGLVAEGRDMGSMIFPDAIIKIFLTASTTTRAKRRHNQLKEKGINVSLSQLIDELEARDKRDTFRVASPLIVPEDALVIKTDNKSVGKVQERVMIYIGNTIKIWMNLLKIFLSQVNIAKG